MNNEIALVLTTFPDEKSAKGVCELMLKNGLVACVQIGHEVESIYFWKGVECRERETPVSLKIPIEKIDEAREFFLQHHCYECPQWLVLVAQASAAYARWVSESTLR